ncbi:DNA methyltransferase [Methylophilus methylotrophus]|uniref:site-specific DNA-methyltransferase (adenine-specific) n=1 Tax=Methylophilus methylotrophus TaxID=17 RepID=B2MU09_METME|nr:DNA methyltransferase [Methylophilus methylotrophus]ACC85607.1 MmeI [Methylophilus methylotrophus]5HR4_C Chain C, MmeI [Methylophilus methylotrophus]5HR4_J Chain J, MmeI [Methylophilus methylotrophus]
MALSWNEIRRKAIEFSKRWEDASDENSQAKPFLIDFFEVFGITNKRVATFEHAVKKFAKAHKEQSRGFVDLFWPGILLIEMKSRGKDLDKAYDQALDYFSGIAERDLPRYVLVCDFQRFRLTDLITKESVEFLLKDLYQNVRSFGFIAGYQTQVIKPQDPINIKAAERMGKLHDTLKLVGYEGHALELYLVRLLFCLFAEDTTIFEKSLFQEYIETKTLEDGSDLAHHINTLFYVLNTPEQKRLKNLDEHLAAFPYINGKLFEEPLPPAQFDKAMREALLDLCSLDWSRISPAIFGSLFQSIMDAKKRRNLGAHYTSEANILKLIKPLFLDELWVEFEKVKNNKNKLLAFHKKLRGLTFFDPACGCGNFLVITYRELRLLEIEVLRGLHRGGQQVLDIEHLIQINVDQFFGIEIEEFPAQIAQVALWLTDHQMNMKISDEFGNYFARIPLKSTPHILNANALQIDWNDVLEAKKCCFILGNPPFVGKSKQTPGQKADLLSVFGNLKSASDLDLVAAWYPKAAHYIQTNANIRCAFVSTNSITQGEQVSLLWPLLLSLGIKINFAHRTFSWTNEASGVAAVHCVIIGFGLKDSDEKIIYEYESINGEPLAIKAKNINPYLRDGVDVIACKRQQPISKLPSMRYGNKPTDDGNFLFTDEEKNQFITNEPSSEKYFRRFVGGDEFINNTSRWCLWLDGADISEIRAMPLVLARIKKVQEFRLKSSAKPTRQSASTPMKFFYISQPDTDYLLIPETSSENRQFIPIGFVDRNVISSNATYHIPSAEPLIFGLLSSTMHNCWMRNVGGRLESRYRYSASLVYNTFPWIQPNEKQSKAIEEAAFAILKARSNYPNESLAGLYDPKTMPSELLKAHQKLDKAVDSVYGFKGPNTEIARIAFLFETYQKMTSLLPPEKEIKKSKGKN